MKILEETRREVQNQDLNTFFQQLLPKYVPSIEPAEAAILFEAIVRDNQSQQSSNLRLNLAASHWLTKRTLRISNNVLDSRLHVSNFAHQEGALRAVPIPKFYS